MKTPTSFFDALIKRLDVSSEIAMQATWTGFLADLNKGEPSIAVALWELVLDRWLPILECVSFRPFLSVTSINYLYFLSACGSSSQIACVVDLLLRYNTDIGPATASDYSSLTLPVIVRRSLSSALLWECANVRGA